MDRPLLGPFFREKKNRSPDWEPRRASDDKEAAWAWATRSLDTTNRGSIASDVTSGDRKCTVEITWPLGKLGTWSWDGDSMRNAVRRLDGVPKPLPPLLESELAAMWPARPPGGQ